MDVRQCSKWKNPVVWPIFSDGRGGALFIKRLNIEHLNGGFGPILHKTILGKKTFSIPGTQGTQEAQNSQGPKLAGHPACATTTAAAATTRRFVRTGCSLPSGDKRHDKPSGDGADGGASSASRHRENHLRSWLRRKQQSVAMAMAAATHRSALPNQNCKGGWERDEPRTTATDHSSSHGRALRTVVREGALRDTARQALQRLSRRPRSWTPRSRSSSPPSMFSCSRW